MGLSTDGGSVSRDDRVRRVLEVLADSRCALPAVAIFRNAKVRGADFERRVLDSYLKELHKKGHVDKVDVSALDSGKVEPIAIDKEGWFIVTESGLEELGVETE